MKTYILGEDPKLTITIDEESPDSVTISIIDPAGATKINEVSMSLVTTKVYQYIFSTVTTDLEGIYEATITVTKDGNSDKDRIEFEMQE